MARSIAGREAAVVPLSLFLSLSFAIRGDGEEESAAGASNDATLCETPSSTTVKSSLARFCTGLPALSLTTTSNTTRRVELRKVSTASVEGAPCGSCAREIRAMLVRIRTRRNHRRKELRRRELTDRALSYCAVKPAGRSFRTCIGIIDVLRMPMTAKRIPESPISQSSNWAKGRARQTHSTRSRLLGKQWTRR